MPLVVEPRVFKASCPASPSQSVPEAWKCPSPLRLPNHEQRAVQLPCLQMSGGPYRSSYLRSLRRAKIQRPAFFRGRAGSLCGFYRISRLTLIKGRGRRPAERRPTPLETSRQPKPSSKNRRYKLQLLWALVTTDGSNHLQLLVEINNGGVGPHLKGPAQFMHTIAARLVGDVGRVAKRLSLNSTGSGPSASNLTA